MRRRKGQPVHGWLNLDKASGQTSTKAVGAVKRLFDARKAGHAGTLDPLATGILPIAFGEATKTVPFAVNGSKSYLFTVRWGAETTTDDAEGEVVNEVSKRPNASDIESLLGQFTGQIQQVPPQFSAIRIDGARAYDLAREGAEFEIAARTVQVDRLAIVDQPDCDSCVFEADCGKGTYIRSLARDIGRELGCFGHVTALRRTRVATFSQDNAISLEKLNELIHSARGREALMESLLPVEAALDDIPALSVNNSDAARLKRGQSVLLRGRDAPILIGPVYAISRGLLVALGEVHQGELRPTRVFNLAN